MRCSYYGKVLFGSVERIGRSEVGFGGVDLRGLFIPCCPGFTVLTGALDRCEPLVGFVSGELLDPCALGSVVAGKFLAGLEVFY
jgi:hypothetical protein